MQQPVQAQGAGLAGDHYAEGHVMDSAWTIRTEPELLRELEDVERAIARSTTFYRWTDPRGGTRVQVSPALLELAEREHLIVAELRRRRRQLVQHAA
jgi:hypothetical protein